MTTTVLAYLPSPAQGVWQLGPLPLRAYALCILAGIIAALILGDRRWTARGGEPGVIYDVALWAVPFGLIGGRLYHILTDWSTYFGSDGKGFVAALRIWDGGLGIWGAVALGGVGAWIACRRAGIPLPAFGDAIAPGILLAQAIGRLGNYFNQELYGRPTTLPWGLEIYERRNASGALDSLNGVSTGQLVEVVHPTFLYELVWNLLVVAVLIWADRRFKLGHGRLFALYVAGYCMGRFWIELMRSDYATTIADTGIRINSFTSTFVFVGAVVYIMVAPKGREDPAALGGRAFDPGDESAVDELGEELTAVAATSGVVAAATVAGAEDSPVGTSEPAAEADAAQADPDEPAGSVEEVGAEEGLGAVEGDEVADAQEVAPEVHEAAVEGAEEAESLSEDVAAEGQDTDAEQETEAEEPEAEPADTAEADADADADEAGGSADGAAAEEGLGAVEGDEVADAQEVAPEVHEAAVEGAEEAESLSEDVAAEGQDADAEEAEAEQADAEQADTEQAVAQPPPASRTAAEPETTRRRWWRRRSG